MNARPDIVLIHPGGALGDFVLTWPLARSLIASGRWVRVVSAASKAELAAAALGVDVAADHLPPWSGLWRGEVKAQPFPSVELVVAFGERSQPWLTATAQLFPSARVEVERRLVDRTVAIELAERFAARVVLHPPVTLHPAGPVVMHVGSGGIAKQWPLHAWLSLKQKLEAAGFPVRLIAGEAEHERFRDADRARFAGAGGQFVEAIQDLAEIVGQARAFVGADSGPSHLAAQLGTPTLALFGPTDPHRWSPIGPRVSVVQAPEGTMNALTVEIVWESLSGLIAQEQA
jgi:ADP-heptose:LPS heptosyltransferase